MRCLAIIGAVLFALVFANCTSNTDSSTAVESKSVDTTTDVKPAVRDWVTINYLTGHFEPSEHPDFVEIDSNYADRAGMYVRRDAYEAFIRMHDAAEERGIDLVIRSAARNFEYQKGIWERKWTGVTKIEGGKDATVAYPDPKERARAILKFSSMPGTSRHHWGTDLDFNAFENSWFEEGDGKLVYDFLTTHAAEYGFCQPYTPKGENRPNGYEEEKWHWSYMPVSQILTDKAEEVLRDSMISGFQGAEAAVGIRVVENYVLGIDPECR